MFVFFSPLAVETLLTVTDYNRQRCLYNYFSNNWMKHIYIYCSSFLFSLSRRGINSSKGGTKFIGGGNYLLLVGKRLR